MKVLSRTTLALFLLWILSIGFQEVSAEELTVQNSMILPKTIIRGHYDEVLVRQKFVIDIFQQLVLRSQYELVDIRYNYTEDGFLTGLVPIYDLSKFKTTQNQYRVLIFTRDTREMHELLGQYGEAQLQEVLRNEEGVNEVWEARGTIGGMETPIFIWIKTKYILVET